VFDERVWSIGGIIPTGKQKYMKKYLGPAPPGSAQIPHELG